jgi:hypothetical protein
LSYFCWSLYYLSLDLRIVLHIWHFQTLLKQWWLKTSGEFRCSRRVSSSCTTSDTRRGNSFIAIRISVQSINHVNRMLYRCMFGLPEREEEMYVFSRVRHRLVIGDHWWSTTRHKLSSLSIISSSLSGNPNIQATIY